MHQRIPLTREGSNAQSTRLGYWFVGQGSARRGCYHQTGINGRYYYWRGAHTGGHRLPTTRQCLQRTQAAHFPSMRHRCTQHPRPSQTFSTAPPLHVTSHLAGQGRSVIRSLSPGLAVDEDEDAGARPLGSEPIEVLASSGKWFAGLIFCFTGYGTARCIQASASSRVLSFLYLAQG
jgi:hypothetical protein